MLFHALLSYRVGIVARSTLFLDGGNGKGVPYLLSKTAASEISQYKWFSGSYLIDVCINTVGDVTEKSEVVFAMRCQGGHALVWVLFRKSVYWILLGESMDRGNCNKVESVW